jgi:hypothetical protein
MTAPVPADVLSRLKAVLGEGGWSQDPERLAPKLLEWRDRWTGETPFLALPRITADVAAVVGPLADAEADAKRSPGRLARHYAPNLPVRLDAASPRDGEAFLAFGPQTRSGDRVWNLSSQGDLKEAAANLFSYLRAADRSGASGIAIAPIPDHGLGEAINDRLRRAAGFVG